MEIEMKFMMKIMQSRFSLALLRLLPTIAKRHRSVRLFTERRHKNNNAKYLTNLAIATFI